MSGHYDLWDDKVPAVVDAVVPLTHEATAQMAHNLSHAVGHNLGPSQHRNAYSGYAEEVHMTMATSLGLIETIVSHFRDRDGKPMLHSWVTDAGMAWLRGIYGATRKARGLGPLKAYLVDCAKESDNAYFYSHGSENYGHVRGEYVLGTDPASIRADVVRSSEGSVTYAQIRVRRARELDHHVREAWFDSIACKGHLVVPPRAIFAGPWIDWDAWHKAKRAAASEKESAA